MKDSERPAAIVLTEMAPMLALLATRGLYDEQPSLWAMGERGRAHTLEDFSHHFRALQALDAESFRSHVAYCEALFADRGYPRQWLHDAWRWMANVIREHLPAPVAEPALAILAESTDQS